MSLQIVESYDTEGLLAAVHELKLQGFKRVQDIRHTNGEDSSDLWYTVMYKQEGTGTLEANMGMDFKYVLETLSKGREPNSKVLEELYAKYFEH